jgi:hypothetical protein
MTRVDFPLRLRWAAWRLNGRDDLGYSIFDHQSWIINPWIISR